MGSTVSLCGFRRRLSLKIPNCFQRRRRNSSLPAYCARVLHQTVGRSLNVFRTVYGCNDSVFQKSGLFTGKVPSDLLYLWLLPPKTFSCVVHLQRGFNLTTPAWFSPTVPGDTHVAELLCHCAISHHVLVLTTY